MGNKIKRTTVFIEVVALTNSTAFKVGETVRNYKDDLNRWVATDENGKRWQNLAKNLRNENFYRFVNQYSMSDIIYYLMDRNIDYQTVMWEMLVEAVEITFKEARVTCIDDIYKYIVQHLI